MVSKATTADGIFFLCTAISPPPSAKKKPDRFFPLFRRLDIPYLHFRSRAETLQIRYDSRNFRIVEIGRGFVCRRHHFGAVVKIRRQCLRVVFRSGPRKIGPAKLFPGYAVADAAPRIPEYRLPFL